MPNHPSLSDRFPLGTKYVLERHGPRVKRYVEYPNGRRVWLPCRQALTCSCLEFQQIGIVPNAEPDATDTKITA